MAQVELKNVDKSFGKTKVIRDVHLSIEKGEFVVLLDLLVAENRRYCG